MKISEGVKSERISQSFGNHDSQNCTMIPLQLMAMVKTLFTALTELSATNGLVMRQKDIFISLQTRKALYYCILTNQEGNSEIHKKKH